MISLVSLQKEDATKVSRLFSHILDELPFYNRAAKQNELKKHRPSNLRKALEEGAMSGVIARRGKRVLGFCFLKDDDGTVWLSWIGVHRDFRRDGVAAALMAAIERYAISIRAHKIWCDSRTNNTPSIKMLQQAGYRKICTISNHWYRQDFFLWEKTVG